VSGQPAGQVSEFSLRVGQRDRTARTLANGAALRFVGKVASDRSEASRALAKAIAYKQCGKDREAEQWARRLVEILECAAILRPER
jgi:hypothetical protein